MIRIGNVVRVLNNYYSNNLVVIYTNSLFAENLDGCTYSREVFPRNSDKFWGITTYLAQGAQTQDTILAHELGHALFFNQLGKRMPQPEKLRDPKNPASKRDPFHTNSPPENIMNAQVPSTIEDNITDPTQCNILKSRGLLYKKYDLLSTQRRKSKVK